MSAEREVIKVRTFDGPVDGYRCLGECGRALPAIKFPKRGDYVYPKCLRCYKKRSMKRRPSRYSVTVVDNF